MGNSTYPTETEKLAAKNPARAKLAGTMIKKILGLLSVGADSGLTIKTGNFSIEARGKDGQMKPVLAITNFEIDYGFAMHWAKELLETVDLATDVPPAGDAA